SENKAAAVVAHILLEMDERRLYEHLGDFTSIRVYAFKRFRYSYSKTRDLIETARNVRTQPLIRAAWEAGDVPWTAARTAARGVVAEPEKEALWAERLQTLSVRALERFLHEALGEEPTVRRVYEVPESQVHL